MLACLQKIWRALKQSCQWAGVTVIGIRQHNGTARNALVSYSGKPIEQGEQPSQFVVGRNIQFCIDTLSVIFNRRSLIT